METDTQCTYNTFTATDEINFDDEYFKTIKKEFIMFLLKEDGGIYQDVEFYLRRTWKCNIYQFLNEFLFAIKPQNLLNTGFNFYKTKEGFDYWDRISRRWKEVVQRKYNIREAIKKRNQN
jgi:hypothetical protein